MCGIAGIISCDASFVSLQQLRQMTDSIAHRGPDGEGHWISPDGHAGFGHRRLSIIDLTPAAKQPFHYLGRYSIIHNGEIYNYVELKKELEGKGFLFTSKTDTEVIIAAYHHFGKNCLQLFDGMFSFAIWDDKEKKLFAARDRFGEKPFFYYLDGKRLVFASEIKALWAAGVEKKVNKKLLFNYLTIGYTDNPSMPDETFYDNIRKLPAATWLEFILPDFKITTSKYWDSTVENHFKTGLTENEIAEQFTGLLTNSVFRRLRSDVPVGTSLSGGLDSSTLAAVISEISCKKYKSFSCIFPGFEKNEEHHINTIVEKFSLPATRVIIEENRLVSLVEKVAAHLDEPFGSASNLAQFAVYEAAKQEGYKVLLDGQGADEILAGYTKYYKWFWQELFRKRKLYKSGELNAAKKNGIAESFQLRNIIASLLPGLASVILERRYLMNAINHPDLTREFVQHQSREAYYTKPVFTGLNDVLYYNTCVHGLEELLRYADRNSMANGVEIRLPFLNHELVEFLFRLPSDFKIRNGYGKWLLRKSMERKLPQETVWRAGKTGFEPPQKKWMENKSMQQLILSAKQKLVNEKILKPEVLDKKINALNAYDADNFDWRYLSASFLFK